MAEEKNAKSAATPRATEAINPEEAAVLERVLKALRQIRYGYVQITIQDGRVVQIERTEKTRLDAL